MRVISRKNVNLWRRTLNIDGIHKVETDLGGKHLSIEVGRMARQANGAVLIQYGETIVLVTAVAEKKRKEDMGFFPLTVDYREKTYAAGKIPGGFYKREGRPRDKEILSARLIDRPIRPLFPDGFRNETQIMALVLSSDQEHDSDVLSIVGASAALAVSEIPFNGPIAGVRVGRVDGQFVVNPTFEMLEQSDIDIILVGSESSVVMVEGELIEVSEEELLEALEYGHKAIVQLVALQKELIEKIGGVTKWNVPEIERDESLVEKVNNLAFNRIQEANRISDKHERGTALDELAEAVVEQLEEEYPEQEKDIHLMLGEIRKADLRRMILEEEIRPDGRDLNTVRPITIEIGVLPRAHGSALFTRGETQALAVATLGTKSDEQIVDDLEGESKKSFMLHYNFPPFSTGEVRFIRGPGRREIGHGMLAERSLTSVVPVKESFPYTIRIVSDVLESNGSSSMATVCGGTLSMMDAGVPIKTPIAGVAMGLIKGEEKFAVLTDILGLEDHLGDMDFKISGSREGITAVQMDIKIKGIDFEIMRVALEKAHHARMHILGEMEKVISVPRESLSPHAPRIITIKIDPDKIRDVIGTGGKVIRKIIEDTGASIDIEDDGTILIASVNQDSGLKAQEIIESLTEEPEIGSLYKGVVRRIVDFGAFIEILPNKEALCHISELEFSRVNTVRDVLNEGDEVLVKVIGIDDQGKIRISRRGAMEPPPGWKPPPPRAPRRGSGGGERRSGGQRRGGGQRRY